MYKIITFFVLLFSSNLVLGQAVGTPYIFTDYKAPYVYQNIEVSYGGSTLNGWINGFVGYGPICEIIINNSFGNPSPSFKSDASNRALKRDFGRSFKNSTIDFDLNLVSGNFGFHFGTQEAEFSHNGTSLLIAPGTSSVCGLSNSPSWIYPNYGPDTKNFNANQWYAVKIIIGDGSAGTINWYVDGIWQGTNQPSVILRDYTYFGVGSSNATYHIDNIKITY